MKIGLFSDLHLEHRMGDATVLVNQLVSEAVQLDLDLVVNAGDTHPDTRVRMQVAAQFLATGTGYVDVLGNHDYWGDVFYDHTVSTVFMQKRILAGTMWTDFNNIDEAEVEAFRFINDFRLIWGIDLDKLHDAFGYFTSKVDSEKPELVISHFGASKGSIHPRWAGSELNPYFCPDAIGHIEHKPKLWLHGHIHDPVDYVDQGVRVVANPLGYPDETYKHFTDYRLKVIEL